jgi:hypothetical protein
MKNLLLLCLYFLSSNLFAQKEYGFDIPWRATSNERILEWFYDQLDSESDSALSNMLVCAGADVNKTHWVYTSNIPNVLSENGQDFYSKNIYSTDSKSKEVQITHKYVSQNELEHKTYLLFIRSPKDDGSVPLALVEYY